MQIKRRKHSVPNLNLASMPDLIFTVLFFFMIVTHMRNVTPRLAYHTPEGTEVVKLSDRQSLMYIFVGQQNGKQTIQLNNQLLDLQQLPAAVSREKSRLSSSQRRQLIAVIKADKNIPVGIIKDVKQALRDADILRMSYVATQKQTRTLKDNQITN